MNTVPPLLMAAAIALAGCTGPVERTFEYSSDGPSRTGLWPLHDGALVGNEAGALVRLSLAGRAMWRVTLSREIAARPVVVGSTVVAATGGGEWVGLSVADGEERWRLVGRSPLFTPLATDGERVFAVTPEGTVIALDPASGAQHWVRPGPPGFKPPDPRRHRPPAPVVAGDAVVVALEGVGLLALSATTGEVRWRVPLAQPAGLCADGARVYAVSWQGTALAVDPAQGKPLWTRALGVPVTSGPSVVAGLLWVGAEGNLLIGLRLNDGSEAHRSHLPGPMVAGVAARGELVLVPTAGPEGYLVGLRPQAEDGRAVAFEVRLDNPLRSAPVVERGAVLVPLQDGRVVGLRIKSEDPEARRP